MQEQISNSSNNNLNSNNVNTQKLTYTIPEVAERLSISVSQTYKLVNQNELPAIRLGKRILVSIKKLEDFINQ